MNEMIVKSLQAEGIDDKELVGLLKKSIQDVKQRLMKVLLIPPDLTRGNSGAGKIPLCIMKCLRKAVPYI